MDMTIPLLDQPDDSFRTVHFRVHTVCSVRKSNTERSRYLLPSIKPDVAKYLGIEINISSRSYHCNSGGYRLDRISTPKISFGLLEILGFIVSCNLTFIPLIDFTSLLLF